MKTYKEFIAESQSSTLTENYESFSYNNDHAMFYDRNIGTYVHVWGVKDGNVVVKKNSKEGNGRGQVKITSKKAIEAYVAYVKREAGI
ncbi:hypothetical protein RPN187_gp147 [Escherichia phage vB_EcoM-RPN187]|nr:hypothetical protein RPN187_gp147 [Escherichia phage vB_EcoM-RPN187]WPK34621.1 hypothetical protein [Escherichia phage AV112]WPK34881.1 hypothetical protein [Escherichia phage AV113]